MKVRTRNTLLFCMVLVVISGCATSKFTGADKTSEKKFQQGLKYSIWLFNQPIDILKDEPFEISTKDRNPSAREIRRFRQKEREPGLKGSLGYSVQVASFRSRENARRFLQEISRLHPGVAFRLQFAADLWRVLVGDFVDRFEAEKLLDQLKKNGFRDAWIFHY